MSSLSRENIPHLCRACLRNLKKNNQPLLDGKQQGPAYYNIDRTQNLHKWMAIINPLEDVARLKSIQHHQQYPQYVCRSCYENFNHLNDFKEMVVHSFNVLTKLLASDDGGKPTKVQQPVLQCELAVKTETVEDIGDNYAEEDDDVDDDEYTGNDYEMDDTIGSDEIDKDLLQEENSELLEPLAGTSSSSPLEEDVGQPKATKAYKCPICKNSYIHRYTYIAHIRQMHLGIEHAFECDICHKTYTKFCNLYRHMRKDHNQSLRQYKCEYNNCNRSFRQLTTRRKHYEKFHNHEPLPNNVEKISHECLRQEEMQNSQHSSTGPSSSSSSSLNTTTEPAAITKSLFLNKRNYICPICTTSFETSYNLKVHMDNDHKKDLKYRCYICGKHKISQLKLDEHISTVHRHPDVTCQVCKKVLKSKSHLRQHVLSVHNNFKPYSCEFCPAMFAAKNTLKVHTRLHTGEKPFKCYICDRRFTQLTPMKKHLITHEKGHRNAIE